MSVDPVARLLRAPASPGSRPSKRRRGGACACDTRSGGMVPENVTFARMPGKYGMSLLDLLGLLGPMFVIGPFLLWMLVFGPLLLYPLARWKTHRESIVDPQLGVKFALSLFALI